MNEISLHILDILQNSREAGASKILLWILEDPGHDVLKFKVVDNGNGMEQQLAERALDPFMTTRTTRKVGLGLPMLRAMAELCNGYLRLKSETQKGTCVEACFQYSHLDRQPLGDLAGTLCVFLTDYRPIHLRYIHRNGSNKFCLDSHEFERTNGEISPDRICTSMLLRELIELGLANLRTEVS